MRLLQRLGHAVSKFLERVRVEADTVHVGPVQLRGEAEVEMRFPAGVDPRACLDELRGTVELTREIVAVSREAVAATQEAMRSFGDPMGRGTERCQRFETMARELDHILREGQPLHPTSIAALHRVLVTHFRDGDAAIEVPVTTMYRY